MNNLNLDMPWEQCMSDLPLPPLNCLSSTSSEQLPQLEILDLFPFEQDPNTDQSIHSDLTFTSPITTTTTGKQTINISSTTHHIETDDDTTHTNPSSATNSTTTDINSGTSSPNISTTYHHIKLPTKQNNQIKTNLSDQTQQIEELTTRLSAAGSETAALRKRVAALTGENRSLRAALDHANARLIAVAQAAAAQPPLSTTCSSTPTTTSSPIMLGLAQVSSDVANKLTNVLSISDPNTSNTDDSPRERKKRKRGVATTAASAAATTMACVMFMWGAFIGTPGLLKSSSNSFRSDANLPALWTASQTNSHAVMPIRTDRKDDMDIDRSTHWLPNCKRVLQVLPTGKEIRVPQQKQSCSMNNNNNNNIRTQTRIRNADENSDDDSDNKMFVDVDQDELAANLVAKADLPDRRHPEYSYVLCRDADKAISNIKACAQSLKNGKQCGVPQTISLILPAAAAGMSDNQEQPALAEVQCSITSVARILVEDGMENEDTNSSTTGRVIATIPETNTVIQQ